MKIEMGNSLKYGENGKERFGEVDGIFASLQEIKPTSAFEKLPKNVLAEVLMYLLPCELAIMWRINKFFFFLLCNSTCATVVWKALCHQYFEKINENQVEELVNELKLAPLEKKLNTYCIFFKHYLSIEWDPQTMGKQIWLIKFFLFSTQSQSKTKKQAVESLSKTTKKLPRRMLLDGAPFSPNKSSPRECISFKWR